MIVLFVTGGHIVQINISYIDFQILDGETENTAYFCSCCLPNVTKALKMYQMFSKLDLNGE